MPVWILATPCLALASRFGHALSSSVIISFSCEHLTIKWVTITPSIIRIFTVGIAPDCLLYSEVSAVVVVTNALEFVLIWILTSPCLTRGPTSGLALSSSVILSSSVSASRSEIAPLFLLQTCIIKWFAFFPALFSISGIAPYCF